MRYLNLVKENARKFTGDESVMWANIELVDELLDDIKEEHPDIYWMFMRKSHELMYGKHFNEEYAKWEVGNMYHIGEDGKTYKGEHWSLEQTNAVFSKYRSKINSNYNEYDFYVALNAQYHDVVCVAKHHFGSEDALAAYIIEEAVAVWFNDADWSEGKVWDYFAQRHTS